MKKNKLFIAGLVTVFVALVSLTLVSSTWAKYTSNGLTPESYRFIGTTQVTGSAKYRTYFAKDPNYDTDATLNNVETFSKSTSLTRIDIFNSLITS